MCVTCFARLATFGGAPRILWVAGRRLRRVPASLLILCKAPQALSSPAKREDLNSYKGQGDLIFPFPL
jgi:hypothetical protein